MANYFIRVRRERILKAFLKTKEAESLLNALSKDEVEYVKLEYDNVSCCYRLKFACGNESILHGMEEAEIEGALIPKEEIMYESSHQVTLIDSQNGIDIKATGQTTSLLCHFDIATHSWQSSRPSETVETENDYQIRYASLNDARYDEFISLLDQYFPDSSEEILTPPKNKIRSKRAHS